MPSSLSFEWVVSVIKKAAFMIMATPPPSPLQPLPPPPPPPPKPLSIQYLTSFGILDEGQANSIVVATTSIVLASVILYSLWLALRYAPSIGWLLFKSISLVFTFWRKTIGCIRDVSFALAGLAVLLVMAFLILVIKTASNGIGEINLGMLEAFWSNGNIVTVVEQTLLSSSP